MDTIEVVYDKKGHYLIKLGDNAVELSAEEAEQLLFDLAAAMKDTYYANQKGKDNA